MNVQSLLDKMIADEARIASQPFFAPAVGRGRITLRVNGIVFHLKTDPANTTGWCVFETLDMRSAHYLRDASLAERTQYLSLFPPIRLIISDRRSNRWFGVTANRGDERFQIEGEIGIELPEEVQRFDTVLCRFDGTRCWFDRLDPQSDPTMPEYLRLSLEKKLASTTLDRSGMTPAQRAVYELNLVRLTTPTAIVPGKRVNHCVDPVAAGLRQSLSHAGASLVDYVERNDGYRVTFSVDGRRYTSSVEKESFGVQVAGICLNGEDAKFDLESLVGVLRKGDRGGALLRIGDDGMSESEYWDIHPPNA